MKPCAFARACTHNASRLYEAQKAKAYSVSAGSRLPAEDPCPSPTNRLQIPQYSRTNISLIFHLTQRRHIDNIWP